MADAKKAEFPKVMVRVRLADTGQYEADVRLVGDSEAETAAKAEHYMVVDPPPASPFPEYPKWVYQKDGQRRIVQTKAERDKLEGDWGDVPVDEAEPPCEPEKAKTAAPAAPPEARPARSTSART